MRRSLVLAILASLAVTAQAPAAAHNQPQTISIPDSGSASPFGAGKTVLGEPGLITKVKVTLHDVTHTNPADLDISLRSPGGTTVGLMSDMCGAANVSSRTWTFDDSGGGLGTDNCDFNGTFAPENSVQGDAWPNAVSTPEAYDLSRLTGQNPNGTWRLYVFDDLAGDSGQILGYTITLTVGGSEIQVPGGPSSEGPASQYPAKTTVSTGGFVTDVDVLMDGITHGYPEDLEVMLEGPRGQKVRLMSDACGQWDVVDFDWDIDDEAPAGFPNEDACPTLAYRPFNHPGSVADEDDFPAPAPGGPYGSSLSDFDGTRPDGEWRLWIFDDEEDDAGFLVDGYDLQIATRPGAAVDLGPDQTVPEGGAARVTVTRPVSGPVGEGTIRVRTQDGTAQAGSDYTPVDTVLTFAPGEQEKAIDVPIAADGGGEPGQAFSVVLAEPGGDASAGRASSTVSIPADPVGRQPLPPPATAAFNAANAASLPSARRCKPRRARLRFRAKAPAGVTLARTELFVNGRRLADKAAAKAGDPITVRVRKRRTKVRIRITATDGRVVTKTRTYKRCKSRRRRG